MQVGHSLCRDLFYDLHLSVFVSLYFSVFLSLSLTKLRDLREGSPCCCLAAQQLMFPWMCSLVFPVRPWAIWSCWRVLGILWWLSSAGSSLLHSHFPCLLLVSPLPPTFPCFVPLVQLYILSFTSSLLFPPSLPASLPPSLAVPP